MPEFKSNPRALRWVGGRRASTERESGSVRRVAAVRNVSNSVWQNISCLLHSGRHNRRILILKKRLEHKSLFFLLLRENFLRSLEGAESFELILIFSVSTCCTFVFLTHTRLKLKSPAGSPSSLITAAATL